MNTGRVYCARLAGITVFDPIGDQVGRVRDVVLLVRESGAPAAVGLVVEVPGRRRVFMPLSRVTSMRGGQVLCTGVVNLRRFKPRASETLAIAEMLERFVTLNDGSGRATIEDIAIEETRQRTWQVVRLYVRREDPRKGPLGIRRRGEALEVSIDDVALTDRPVVQGAALVVQSLEGLKPADLAAALMEMPDKRRAEVAAALDDERLADVIQELSEDDQVALMGTLHRERAADILDAMEPDDAADLLGDLPEREATELLDLMEPSEAEGVRQLMQYADDTAGGLMTTEPVIVGPETTVAMALALVRKESLTPALATVVLVVRPPLDTPTGRLLGVVHIQRLLREVPHEKLGNLMDPAIEPLLDTDPLSEVSRRMAAYDAMVLPVVDAERHVLGAVSVDDVLDHVLPADWRDQDRIRSAPKGVKRG